MCIKAITKKLITYFLIINWAFFDIQYIKGQEYLAKSTSPKGTYTVTAYLNNGGATVSYAVLGTLTHNKKDKTKNIYWEYRCEKADMAWLDDETIVINGVKLKVKNEIYDFRQHN